MDYWARLVRIPSGLQSLSLAWIKSICVVDKKQMTPSPFFAHPSANKIEYSRVIRLVSRVLCSGKLFLANSMLAAQWGDYLVAKLMYYSPLAKCLQSLANHRVIWSSPRMFVQLDTLASYLPRFWPHLCAHSGIVEVFYWGVVNLFTYVMDCWQSGSMIWQMTFKPFDFWATLDLEGNFCLKG